MTDPFWYQDAVFYELHVRAFQDGNDDGIGDFVGLTRRLDYLKDLIARLNRIRRENPALHEYRNLRFYEAQSEHILFFGKATATRDNVILAAVNLDPFQAHEARLTLPLAALGVAPDEAYELTELLSGTRRLYRGPQQTVTLDPQLGPAVIWRLGRWRRREQDFDYFA